MQGRLPEGSPTSGHPRFIGVRHYADGGTYREGGTDVPAEGAGSESVAFRLELPASAPPREEALQGLPSLKAWKGFYEVGFLSGSAMPEVTLRCGDGEAVAVRLEKPFDALVVAEDPSSPGGLRVVQHRTPRN